MRGLIGLVVASSVVSGAANAANNTLWNEHINGWLAGAYTREGTFSHCAASATYRSGMLLLFSINRNLNWSMGIVNPAWNLTNGSRYPVEFNVDLADVQPSTATAINSHAVEIDLRSTKALFESFRSGKTLYIHANTAQFQFNLTNTAKVLATLLHCAESGGQRPQVEVANTNPFASSKEKASKDRTAERSEAMVVAANLVSAMGLKGFTFLNPGDIPDSMPMDAAWKTSSGITGVAVIANNTDASSISSSIIGFDAKICKNKFASGSLPERDGNWLFTKCGDNNNSVMAYYLIVARKAGGKYVISSYAVDGKQSPEEPKSELKAAAFKAIPH